MSKQPDLGQSETHTPLAGAGDQALTGADPLDLLAGSPDLGVGDLLAMAAEPTLTQRRARGRPAGALNRKNADMIQYLAALGHRDPWVTLSLIQSADTMKLAEALRVPMQEDGRVKCNEKGEILYNPPQPLAVLSIQKAAAEALMKFHHSAKPQQLELPDGGGSKRAVMIIGDGNNVAVIQGNGFASDEFLPPAEVQQNQGVIEGEAVRQKPDQSHD